MISFEFWKALQRPPRSHTLYKRVARKDLINVKFIDNILVVTVALTAITILTSTAFASILLFLAMLGIPVLMLRYGLRFGLTGMANGLRWAVASSEALVAFRRNGLYDLLCLTPPGPLGVNWAVSTGVFYRMLQAGRYQTHDLWAGRMYIVIPVTILLATRHGLSDQPLAQLLCILLYFALVIGWFRFEDTQSTTLGGLIGMLVPTFSRNAWEVRIGALGLFALVQVLSYTLSFVLLLALLPAFYISLNLRGWLATYSHYVLTLILLAALREIAILLLWRLLLQRLNLDNRHSVETVTLVY